MPLGSQLNSLILLARNFNPNKTTVSTVKHRKPDKTRIFSSDNKINRLPRVTPEEVGYDSKYVESFINELGNDLSVYPNRLMVIKDGKVIAERYQKPYVDDSWNCVFSATKTVTALALGALWDEGKVDLNEPVCKTLGIENKVGNLRNKKITLKHLLTMSTGNAYNEIESAVATKWTKDFFDSVNKFAIGSKFEYNSLNTYIIGAVIEKITGKGLEEYLREKILEPLGINDILMETSPEGVAKSGWGLYIIPEDLAKLAVLVSNEGVWEGKRIISKEWLDQMTYKQISATKVGHVFDYGYQTWVDEERNFCFFNGMYNQDAFIFRNTGVVVLMFCANNEAFHGSNHYAIVPKYFAYPAPEHFEYVEALGKRDYPNADNLLYYYDKIANVRYVSAHRRAASVGIMPLLLQNEMGTYSKGIKSMTFVKDEEGYALTVEENGVEYRVDFDFADGVRKAYEFYGNLYDCAVSARFSLSEKLEPTLVIRIFFLEFASSRFFTIRFGKSFDRLTVEASENPGVDFITALLDSQDAATKKTIQNLGKLINPDVLESRARNIFSPSFTLERKPLVEEKQEGDKEE